MPMPIQETAKILARPLAIILYGAVVSTGMIMIGISAFVPPSFAQDAIDVSCRAQAKDVAVQTYQSCVTEARTQKIDEIRSEYQTKLNELKNYYNEELQRASGKNVSGSSNQSNKAKNQKQGRKAKKDSSIVSSLPQKTTETKTGLTAQGQDESGMKVSIKPNRSSSVEEDTIEESQIINPEN